jgi:hypothetical protein
MFHRARTFGRPTCFYPQNTAAVDFVATFFAASVKARAAFAG